MTAKIPNVQALINIGMDPKTKLPLKMVSSDPERLHENIRMQLRIIDEQDAVNRYTWYNLPCNLTSQELERMLYYKGQLGFFYYKALDEFYFMPVVLDGTLDFYGRWNGVHPIPLYATGKEEENKKTSQQKLLEDLKLNVVHGMKDEEDLEEQDLYSSCVILRDYTPQWTNNYIVTPRQQVNDSLVSVMAECIPFMRTAMIAGTGVKGVRVNDADQATEVKEGSQSVETSAKTGNIWVPLIGQVEFQDITVDSALKAQDFMLAMQSLDNLRLSTYGIDNGGLFEKKAHELQSEADINGGPVGLVMQDGLSIRQNFCNIVNSIWDLGIWCEVNQNVLGADIDGDGMISEEDEDGANTGVEGDSDE